MPARPSTTRGLKRVGEDDPAMHVTKSYRGEDEFGTLVIHANETCAHCGKQTNFVARYRKGSTKFHLRYNAAVPEGLKGMASSNLILRHMNPLNQPYTYLGITCGCYAKGHRQIARVMESIKKAPSKTS